MSLKKLLVMFLLVLTLLACVGTVNAGFFDFLGINTDNDITKEFDYADGVISIDDNDNDSYVKLKDTKKSWENRGFIRKDLYICKLDLNLNIKPSDIKWVKIEGSGSQLGTSVEKELTGNITKIINDSLHNKSDMNLTNFYLEYDVKDYMVEIHNDIYHENSKRMVYLDPKKIKIEDDKIIFNSTAWEKSAEYDLTQVAGTNVTIHLVLKGESSSISLLTNANITQF